MHVKNYVQYYYFSSVMQATSLVAVGVCLVVCLVVCFTRTTRLVVCLVVSNANTLYIVVKHMVLRTSMKHPIKHTTT